MLFPHETDPPSDREMADLQARIVAQADAQGECGWMEIAVPTEVRPDGKLRVPRGAFEQWAVARSGGGHLATPWTPVSRQGVKQMGDDVFHTDWMLGAGLNLDAMRPYGSLHKDGVWEKLRDAVHEARFGIEQRLLKFRCSVLLQGPFVAGRITVPTNPQDLPEHDGERPPVVILRDAGPTYLDVALAALDEGGAVIVEHGGEMAHLVTVLRETGKGPIVRVPEARRKYPPGAVVYVHAATGEVSLQDEPYSRFANDSDPFGDGSRYERTPEDDVPEPDYTAKLVEPDNGLGEGA